MQPLEFPGPRLKISRARQFIEEFQTDLENYATSRPYRIFRMNLSHKPGPPEHGFKIHVDGQIPWTMRLAFGDAIHCLRSALDLLACDLVRFNNQDPQRVSFPIAKTTPDLPGLLKRSRFHLAGAGMTEILQKIIQPTSDSNPMLYALSVMDNRHKHDHVLELRDVAYIKNAWLVRDGMKLELGEIGLCNPRYPIHVGCHPSFELAVDLRACAFPSDPPEQVFGMTASELLDNLVKMTEKIVSIFEYEVFNQTLKSTNHYYPK